MKERPVLTVNQWLASVPEERRDAINTVRDAVNERLPRGYEETVDWGMLAWVVPLARFANTHNGRPLMLAALGAHTKVMTIYLMTVYGDPKIRKEFEIAYRKAGKRLDMGGCCVHFKTLEDLPLDVVGDTIARVAVDPYVEHYEKTRAKRKPKKSPKTTTKGKPKAKAKRDTKANVKATNTSRFRAVILSGHKEAAVEVPFDPGVKWAAVPVSVRPGRRGYPVRTRVGTTAFASFVVRRSRRFFLLLGPGPLSEIGASPGDTITVSVSPATVPSPR